MRIIDWKAVKKFIAERKPIEVSAGILNDWFWTAATVYESGKWIRNHGAFVQSDWACPGFKATMENGDVLEVAANKEMSEKELRIYKEASARTRKKMHRLAEQIRAKNEKVVRDGTKGT